MVPSKTIKQRELQKSMAAARFSFRQSSALNMSFKDSKVGLNRRSYIVQVATAISTLMAVNEGMVLPANAMPFVTVAEFESILRTSGKFSSVFVPSMHVCMLKSQFT
jgi:hypothetical protein